MSLQLWFDGVLEVEYDPARKIPPDIFYGLMRPCGDIQYDDFYAITGQTVDRAGDKSR